MLKCDKINYNISSKYSPTLLFKSKNEDKIKRFQTEQAKRNYIDSKTQTLGDFVGLTFIASLFLKAQDISFSNKLKPKEWVALGMFSTACISLITLLIKKDQYAKEFDKEMKNDTKNYA